MLTLEILVDIPNNEIEGVKQQFVQLGFTVKTVRQASGLWSLAAAK